MTDIISGLFIAFVAWCVWNSEEPFWAKPLAVVAGIFLLIGGHTLIYG
jgi:hypothetical protein